MTNVRYQSIQMYKLLDFINLNNLTKVFIDCQDHVKIKNDNHVKKKTFQFQDSIIQTKINLSIPVRIKMNR